MYKSRDGNIINADCNGAANIMKKVAIQLGLTLDKVVRGCKT
jgi:putative transposase